MHCEELLARKHTGMPGPLIEDQLSNLEVELVERSSKEQASQLWQNTSWLSCCLRVSQGPVGKQRGGGLRALAKAGGVQLI